MIRQFSLTRLRSAGCALLLAALCLIPAGAQANGTDAPPVYPSAQATAPAPEEQAPVRIPRISAQQENFYLAVSDAAAGSINNQQVLDALRPVLAESNSKILIGVDREPNNLSGAKQLVRGLLLFGDSDALSDDWIENGQSKGYVGKGWIVVGVMLPEKPGDPVEIAVEPGRNVRAAVPAAATRVQGAGAQEFSAQNYTGGLIAVASATATGYSSPKDLSQLKYWALGVLGILAIALLIGLWAARYRKRRAGAAAQRMSEAEGLCAKIRQQAPRLRKLQLPQLPLDPAGPSAIAFTQIRAVASEVNAHAQELASGYGLDEPIERAQLAALRSALTAQQALVRAIEHFNALLGSKARNELGWTRIVDTHRERLQDTAQFLDTPGASGLNIAPRLRAMLIEHTNALERAREWIRTRKTRTSAAMLDELWALRRALQDEQRTALEQAAARRLNVAERLLGTMGPDRGAEHQSDAITDFEIACRIARNWSAEHGQEAS